MCDSQDLAITLPGGITIPIFRKERAVWIKDLPKVTKLARVA